MAIDWQDCQSIRQGILWYYILNPTDAWLKTTLVLRYFRQIHFVARSFRSSISLRITCSFLLIDLGSYTEIINSHRHWSSFPRLSGKNENKSENTNKTTAVVSILRTFWTRHYVVASPLPSLVSQMLPASNTFDLLSSRT